MDDTNRAILRGVKQKCTKTLPTTQTPRTRDLAKPILRLQGRKVRISPKLLHSTKKLLHSVPLDWCFEPSNMNDTGSFRDIFEAAARGTVQDVKHFIENQAGLRVFRRGGVAFGPALMVGREHIQGQAR